MTNLIVFLCLVAISVALPRGADFTDEEINQNKNARYEFESNVEDHINDLVLKRSEVRDGLNVKGSYSYSDGYVKRTISYVADENGYHITSEEVEALSGPKVDINGIASVLNRAHGTELRYSVKSEPLNDDKTLVH